MIHAIQQFILCKGKGRIHPRKGHDGWQGE